VIGGLGLQLGAGGGDLALQSVAALLRFLQGQQLVAQRPVSLAGGFQGREAGLDDLAAGDDRPVVLDPRGQALDLGQQRPLVVGVGSQAAVEIGLPVEGSPQLRRRVADGVIGGFGFVQGSGCGIVIGLGSGQVALQGGLAGQVVGDL